MQVSVRARARRDRAGHTLLEATIALGVMLLAVLAYSRSVTGGVRDQAGLTERTTALNAAREMLETLRGTDFAQVYALYNGNDADDPGGAGTAFGDGFAIDGLLPQAGDADGLPGRILFPEGPVGNDLREDLVLPQFGLPYDLNASGDIQAAPVNADYQLLPVRVRVEWTGSNGDQELEVRTWLAASI